MRPDPTRALRRIHSCRRLAAHACFGDKQVIGLRRLLYRSARIPAGREDRRLWRHTVRLNADLGDRSRRRWAGRYFIQRLLGERERKQVYLAHDERVEREVALALIAPEPAMEGGMTLTRWEAHVTAQLTNHPHIVTIFDYDDAGFISRRSRVRPVHTGDSMFPAAVAVAAAGAAIKASALDRPRSRDHLPQA